MALGARSFHQPRGPEPQPAATFADARNSLSGVAVGLGQGLLFMSGQPLHRNSRERQLYGQRQAVARIQCAPRSLKTSILPRQGSALQSTPNLNRGVRALTRKIGESFR